HACKERHRSYRYSLPAALMHKSPTSYEAMFRKRKEPARDNTESQVTMEQIRRRMVANVVGSEAPLQSDAGSEGALATVAIASEYPALPGQGPSYESAQQNLREAREICEVV